MTPAGDWQVSSRSHQSRSHSTLHGRHKVVTRSWQLHRSHSVVAVAVTSQLHHSHNCEQRFIIFVFAVVAAEQIGDRSWQYKGIRMSVDGSSATSDTVAARGRSTVAC